MMTISKLAAAGGVGVETIRYYQRRGLLDQPERGAAGEVRRYGDADVQRLRLIRAAQNAGFTLEEIGTLIGLDGTRDRARVRAMARDRIARIDDKIAELRGARDALAGLARDCAVGTAGPCPILDAFSA